MKKNGILNQNSVLYGSLFMLIFLTSSFVVTNNIISSAATIGLWLLTFFLLFLKWNKNVNPQLLFVAFVSLGCIWTTNIIRNENTRNTFVLSFAFLTALLFVVNYTFLEFKKVYIQIMKIICTISLVMFLLYLLLPALNNYFVVKNANGHLYSNLYIYVNSEAYIRNMSMFWEPGAFQTFVALALLFEVVNESPNIKTIAIFIISIITTFSTTGYIALAMIFLVVMLDRKYENNKIRRVVLCIILVLVIFTFGNQELLFSTNSSTVFGKLIGFFNNRDYNRYDSFNSASVRYFAIIKPAEAFIKAPILGWGYQGLSLETSQYTHGMNTCTFINWFATYGVLFGTIMVVGCNKLVAMLYNDFSRRIAVLLVLFTITASENYVNNAFVWGLMLYGYKETIVNKTDRK